MDADKTKIEKLRGNENWSAWKFQLQILLDARDALEVVTGELRDPGEPDDALAGAALTAHNRKRADFKKANKVAKELIVTTVEKKPLQLLLTCDTAKAMWDKLLGVYEQKSETSVSMVQTQFYQYVKELSDDIATHISKVEGIAERLKQLGEPVPDSMVMTKILNTLPSEFNHFASAWESTPKAERTRENLTARLLTEEIRMKSVNESSTVALSAKTKPGNMKAKFHKSHRQQANKSDMICYNCREKGHISRNCNRPKPLWKKPIASATDSIGRMALVTNTDIYEFNAAEDWYVDSGSTDHITSHFEYFAFYEEFATPLQVRIGNNTYLQAKGRGTVNILCLVDGEWFDHYMINVLYVPDIAYNLFSVGAAMDKGLVYRAERNTCVLIKDDQTVAIGIRKDRLYKLLIRVQVPATPLALTARESTLQLWHERLGHQNKKHVQQFLKSRGISITGSEEELCAGCAYGKQHRQSFGQRIKKASTVGELIHSDVCGPMQEDSIGGARYFCTFKDDFSHYRRVYFLRNKSEVKDKLKDFLSFVETSSGNNVKILLTDGGKEYDNHEVRAILNAAGIEHRKTAPYAPQQNGVAERENSFIVESARSMIHAKGLPLKLWAEAVNTAVYVLNRTGSSPVPGKTPYELWNGKQDTVDNLHVFGTECFVHISKEKRCKWDRRSVKGVLVGYSDNKSSYRVWIPEKDEVFVTHDVLFQGELLCATHDEHNSITETIVNKPCNKFLLDDASTLRNGNMQRRVEQLQLRNQPKYKLRKKSNMRLHERLSFLREAAVLFAECVRPINAMESRNTSKRKKKDRQSVTMSTSAPASPAAKEVVWPIRLFDDLRGMHDKPHLLIDNRNAAVRYFCVQER